MSAGKNRNSRSAVRIAQRGVAATRKRLRRQTIKKARKAKAKAQKSMKMKNRILGDNWKSHRNKQRRLIQSKSGAKKKVRIYVTENRYVIGLRG